MSFPPALRAVTQLVAMLTLAAALPAWTCRVANHPASLLADTQFDRQFDPASERDSLHRVNPPWVLIGNSMLNSRITNRTLTEISGWKARRVAKGGSQSALWFLFFKNIVIESGATPALVTVFFRETDLTLPYFRVEGLNEALNAELHGLEEPEWKQVMAKSANADGNFEAWIRDGLNAGFPSKELRSSARMQMQNRAFRATRGDTGVNSNVRRMELNARFSLAHLRHDLGSDIAPASSDQPTADQGMDAGTYDHTPDVFNDSKESSFLPHLVALAKETGIQLHFHRVKRRPAADNTSPDSPKMQAYMKALRDYLDKNDCLLTDESQDTGLTLDMYADGDHISDDEATQKRYLANFWERVGPVVKPLQQKP